MHNKIQYSEVDASLTDKLTSFFESIHTNGWDKYFHPHPFNKKKAQEICRYNGCDLYFIQTMEKEICGYGMLRGWDEGYKIPSLGIIIHPDYRCKGLGEKFMVFLHERAAKKGAKKIRLKVYPENSRAIHLYRKLNYSFLGKEKGQLLAFVEL